jgi:DNA-binding Xre family transcriptional regulator
MTMYKPIPLEDVMNSLEPGERKVIEARGKQILARIDRRATLAEMRKDRKISQAKLAEMIGIKQMQVSRLEKRKDPRLSTLRRSVEAMGGQLTLIATFPDQEPMVLVAGNGD